MVDCGRVSYRVSGDGLPDMGLSEKSKARCLDRSLRNQLSYTHVSAGLRRQLGDWPRNGFLCGRRICLSRHEQQVPVLAVVGPVTSAWTCVRLKHGFVRVVLVERGNVREVNCT